jgi:hypothetical protein
MIKVVYKITVDDVQSVAVKEIGRELSMDEIKNIQEFIAEKINWHDVLADVINEKITV